MIKKTNLKLSISYALAFLVLCWSTKLLGYYFYAPALNYAKIIAYDKTNDASFINHLLDSMSISLSDITVVLYLVFLTTALCYVILVLISLRILKQHYSTYILSILLIALVFFSQQHFEVTDFTGLIPLSFFQTLEFYLITNGILWVGLATTIFFIGCKRFRK
jgi:hypothetical protein